MLELDSKLGVKLPLDMPWFAWLVEFCADIHNRHQVGRDGRTPWERVKGRRSHRHIIEFGRQILHRVPGKLIGGLMQARFHGGVYVGRRFETSEVLVSMSDGSIVKARDFREVPDASAWDA